MSNAYTADGRRISSMGHAKHAHNCPCGRTLRGNGWKTHARACEAWLTRYGWPLDDNLADAIRTDSPHLNGRRGRVPLLTHVQMAVGRAVLARRAEGNKTPLRWQEAKDLAWTAADEFNAEADLTPPPTSGGTP